MPSRLGHGLYKKINRLKSIFRCIYIQQVELASSHPRDLFASNSSKMIGWSPTGGRG